MLQSYFPSHNVVNVQSVYDLQVWQDRRLELAAGSHLGYILTGSPQLHLADGSVYPLQPGSHFCVPAGATIEGAAASGVVMTHHGFQGAFMLGGPLQNLGKLAYINGGRSDLLLPPNYLGDPCLHELHFPVGVEQTMHYHESDRIIAIISGAGCCVTPTERMEFHPGQVFRIPAGEYHKFMTTDLPLRLVVFHPDSDIGFVRDSHPLLPRQSVVVPAVEGSTASIEPLLIDRSYPQAGYGVRTWGETGLDLKGGSSHLGYVLTGDILLTRATGESYALQAGQYFCLPEAGRISGADSRGLIISCDRFQGCFQIGGAAHPIGRLHHLHGGNLNLLLPPIYVEDPCLLALHFPAQIGQDMHYHESDRIVTLLAGNGGYCDTPSQGRTYLQPGQTYRIPAKVAHRLVSEEEDLHLLIFHPNSSIGFSDRNHPMLRRTMVEGVSAMHLPAIQTP
jgi:quercetin dioxygenase-like cupin family protein